MERSAVSNWLTPDVILTIYASVISTIALGWNITLAILEKWSRLKVSVEFRSAMAKGTDGKLIKGPIVCFIRIVNKGNHIKYISSIDIRLPYKTSTGNIFSLMKLGVKFPIEILPQQEYEYRFTFCELSEIMLEKYKKGKCRIIIVDTIRKKYKSHRFNSDTIKNAFAHNNSLSAAVLSMFNEDEISVRNK